MCLRILGRVAYTASKDIVCYKVLYTMSSDQAADMQRHPDYKPLYLMAPWYSHRYDWCKEYTEEKMPLEAEPLPPADAYAVINYGFHSYPNEDDAMEMCGRMPWRRGCVVAKCVIPKGARYWTGNDPSVKHESHPGYFEYCSDRIRVTAWRLPLRGSKWTSAEDARRERQYLLPAD